MIKSISVGLIIFSYFCSAMDDSDPKGKRELVPFLQQTQKSYSPSQANACVKFIDNHEKITYKNLFKKLPQDVQNVIRVQLCRLYLFDEVSDDYLYIKKISPLQLWNKKLTASELWQLPREKRSKLINRLQSSMWRYSEIFTEQEQHQIIDDLPADVRNGLSMPVLDDSPCLLRGLPIGFGAIVSCIGVVGEIVACISDNTVMSKIGFGLLIPGGPIVAWLFKKIAESDLRHRVTYEVDDEVDNVVIEILSD